MNHHGSPAFHRRHPTARATIHLHRRLDPSGRLTEPPLVRRRVCGLRGFPVGVLVLATTNDSATSPRPLGTLPQPRTAYQASLDIAAPLVPHKLGQQNRAVDSRGRPAVTRPTTSRTRPRRSSAEPCVRPTGVPNA